MSRLWRPAVLIILFLTTSIHGAGRPIAPRDLGPSPWRQSFPAMASADGRFLTVWREERREFGVHIMGSLSDASGRRASNASFLIVPNANPVWMQLVPRADGYTLFWTHSFDVTHMVDLDLDGRVLASRRLDVPYHIQRDIAWNGTHFLMAFKHAAGISHNAEAILFTREGEVVRRGMPIDPQLFNVDVEVGGDAFVVVTAGFDGMFAHRVTADGGVQQTTIVPKRFDTQNRPLRPLAISRGDGTLLVVWSAGDPSRSELRSAVLSESGEIGEGRLIAARNADRRLLQPLLLTRNGGEYTLTFAETDPRLVDPTEVVTMTLDAAGARIRESEPVVLEGGSLPAAASNGSVVAVTYALGFLPQRLLQRAIHASGAAGVPEFVAIARARQRQPILGAGGGRFVAAFTEQAEKFSARLASLDAFGEPRSNRFVATDAEVRASDLAWNGNEYLLVYRGSGIQAVRLDADGNSIDPQPLQFGGGIPVDHAAVTWTGDKWLVVWTTAHETYYAHVSAAGVVTAHGKFELRTQLPEGWFRTLGTLAIGATRTHLLVAWIETQYPPCLMPVCGGQVTKVFLQRFNHTGVPSTNYGVAVAGDPSRVTMISTGEEYLLLIDSIEKTEALLLSSGAATSLLARQSFPAGLSDVIWDGREFVMAQRHRREWPGHLVVTRFDKSLHETVPPRGVLTLKSDETEAPSIAAVMQGDALVAIAEGDPFDGSRAVVYAERDMEPLPGWPPPRRRAVR
jgi:hypothetical protein